VTTALDPPTLEPAPPGPVPTGAAPASTFTWRRTWVVARTDLLQLLQAKDFWVPMVLLGSIFFLFIPTVLLMAITSVGEVGAVADLAESISESAPDQVPTDLSPEGKTSYVLAVFLLAPVAVIVPLTISTAVGAATIVGERERGTGEFLAHSPAHVREIYGGKLIASLIPGYVTTIVGFGLYALVVNLIVGPEVGGWFFPTRQWWLLMFWVVPPFLVLTLSLVLRLSARVKSTAAAQQASGLITLPLILIAYSQSTGALYAKGQAPFLIGGAVGLLAWIVAITSVVLNLRAVTRARLLGVADEQ
jgi:ABC-type Na+ efflux pump permease subunit